MSFWESVRDSDKPQELEAYLKAYPAGTFALLARLRIERLKDAGGSEASQVDPTASLPPLHDCDRLAADPEDNDKVADGVEFEGVVPEQAADACRSAIASYPGTARFEFQLGRALLIVGSHFQAFEQFKKAADKGYASAMAYLGIMYQSGDGIAQDYKLAAEWYHKAAEKGDAFAMTRLGLAYQKGEGVAQDYTQAFEWYHKATEWYRKAADKGEALAMTNLGDMYEEGRFVPQDDKEAFEWYRKAANKGHIGAMYRLGDMYKEGRGVAQDDKAAFEWYRKATEWYRKAANKGNIDAMANLGDMYKEGRGVAQDDRQAVEWYRKAAEKGNARAMRVSATCTRKDEVSRKTIIRLSNGMARPRKRVTRWRGKPCVRLAMIRSTPPTPVSLTRSVSMTSRTSTSWIERLVMHEKTARHVCCNLAALSDKPERVLSLSENSIRWRFSQRFSLLCGKQFPVSSTKFPILMRREFGCK